MIAVQLGGAADEGLDRLHARAYGEQRDLVALAEDVVAGRIRFDA